MTLGSGQSGRGYASRGGEGIRSMQRASGLPPPLALVVGAAALGGGFERLEVRVLCGFYVFYSLFFPQPYSAHRSAGLDFKPSEARPSERLRERGGGLNF